MVATYQQLSRGAGSQWTSVWVNMELKLIGKDWNNPTCHWQWSVCWERNRLQVVLEMASGRQPAPFCNDEPKSQSFVATNDMEDGIEKVHLPGKWSSFPKSWPGLEAPRRWRGLLFCKDIFLFACLLHYLVASFVSQTLSQWANTE